jgi:hypothetical protein
MTPTLFDRFEHRVSRLSRNLMNFWSTFEPWVISAIGGAIGALLLLPSKLGEILFKYRFDKEIETFKADQGAKLERLREQLGHLGDRGRRSNEMEFAAIREVWEKIGEAYLATHNCVANFIQYPDLNPLSAQELDGFLSTTGFSKEQCDQIRKAADHNDMYVKIITWRGIAHAAQANFDVNLLLRKQDALRSEFQSLIDLLRAAQVERELQFQHPQIPRKDWGNSVSKFFESGDRTLQDLAGNVNQRLFRNEP